MHDSIKAFSDTLSSQKAAEYIELGNKIKKLDKSTERKTTLITLTSMVTLTLLGYFAFGTLGAIIFFAIAAISSFALSFSSKKNILLKYLTFYRTRIPEIIAMADGVEVSKKEPEAADFISGVYEDGKLVYRMSHRYGDMYVSYAKFMRGDTPLLQGLLYYTECECEGDLSSFEELLKTEFEDITIKCEDGKALLFIAGANDYLNGRVEYRDDLTYPSLLRQYDYYLLGKRFCRALAGQSDLDKPIFHTAEQ